MRNFALMAFLFVQLLYNFRHNLLISPNGLERLIASEIEIKKHVAKVAEMAEYFLPFPP